MSYTATICRVSPVKHPGADRLQIVTCNGNTVVVGMSVKDGDLGIYFPPEGQLSHEFCEANDLYPRVDESGQKINAGYINRDRRDIRVEKLRGIKSYGMFLSLDVVEFPLAGQSGTVSGYYNKLKDGQDVTTLNGHTIVQKYESPATKKARALTAKSGVKASREHKMLPQHPDTNHWQKMKAAIDWKNVATVSVTRKYHGTSQRTAKVMERQPKFKWFPWLFYKNVPTLVHGTRRVPFKKHAEQYRNVAGDLFENIPLGTAVYYEIVGYDNQTPIMSRVKSANGGKELVKKYGETMVFDYGCQVGDHHVIVYNVVKDGKPLNALDMSTFCADYGFEDGHQLLYLDATEMNDILFQELDKFVTTSTDACLPQELDHERHVPEGVIVRLDFKDGRVQFLKNKSFTFLQLEHGAKEQDVVDREEAS